MIKVPSPVSNDSNVLAVQSYTGLHLEPPERDVIEIDGDVEPVTKEEEVVTKKKTELTTTRQIETRVKRQIVLEDGKVVEDSGPIVETNTTEDTNKQESESVERLKPGVDDVDGPKSIEHFPSDKDQTIIEYVGDDSKYDIDTPTVLAPRADGLVREMKTKKVISREEIQERTETEDVKHLGDFSDQAYINAVNSGVENIQEVLLSPEAQKQLIPSGPRLVHYSTKARKTIDTEDTDLKYKAEPDGTLITEKLQTTEHEEFHDNELPEEDDHSAGSRERIEQTESSQRFSKRRDEQQVEYVADGKTIGKEMRYLAETEDIEREGPQEDASDWDSLSDRVRKARRQQKTLLQQHREAFLERERKGRAIDFEKEEETRKDETIKWLESHFGSEGRSPDSTEEESEKKESFFNVTIKSNLASPVPADEPMPTLSNGVYHSNIKPKEAPKPQKYFQGISGWSERKETTPRKFATKTFQDELKGTLERNRLRNVSSREDLISSRYKEEIIKSDDDARKKSIKTDNRYGSRGDLKTQKEDLGYISGSRTDIRPRHDSKEDLYAKSKKQQSNYLHREDSGYVKGSTEDLRYIRSTPMREDSFIRDSGEEEKLYKDPIKYNNAAIQRDDSAYVSSSTYFTEPRSPKTVPLCTPDSGIQRSPTPEAYKEPYDADIVRPVVPQRKREKKMRIIETSREYEPTHREPAPDYSYSPPNRSRSISPVPSPTTHYRSNPKKMYQKTRFASSSELSRPISTQTIETQTTPVKKNTVGATISNSIRKLVGKIRSASVDRKLKSKAKRSLSPQNSKQSSKQQQQPFNRVNGGGSTYQQYNVIDNHIGQTSLSTAPPSSNRESSIVSSRRDRPIDRRNLSESSTMAASVAKPKYYLGEDPYLSIYGKENKYDGTQRAQRYQSRRQRSEDVDVYNPNRHQSSNTLGRFSKSANRLQTSPSDLDYDYRSAQTLPRKLEHKPMHSSAINIAIVNNARSPSQGPAKPARTYKSINRSKSFNVHGLNGTNNPSPIYMEKLNRNVSHHYRSNPHLNEDKAQLRSPSIVNLISRSQRDLSKIDENGFESGNPLSASTYDVRRNNGHNGHHRNYSPIHYSKNIPSDRRAHSLLRTTSDNYRTDMDSPLRNGHYKYGLERNIQRERESSLGSRSPITINKDTAAIIRRNSSSTEDYSDLYKVRSDNPYRPVTNTVHNFTKKTNPLKNGRGSETIETSERKSVTTSRYRNGDAYSNNLRYVPGIRKNSASPVVIEVRRE